MKKSLNEKLSIIKDMRLIDDVLFEVVADDKEVCQEILRPIIGDDNLIVKDVIVQSSERNLYGRSVRLDALCTLGDDTLCNIEVQRTDSENHLKRARYNSSIITVKKSSAGDTFDDVINMYVVYISEFDVFEEGQTIYHVDKIIRETGTLVDDGLKEIFVNTAVDDGSLVADLMSCFTKKEVSNPKFPKISSKISEIKNSERGVSAMSSIMCDLLKEEREEGLTEGRAEGRIAGRLESLIELTREGLLSIVDAARKAGMTEEEFMSLMQ